jgi:exodeoxyribonuclease VII large subunit
MWRSRAASLKFVPEDGMLVVLSGRLTLYEPRGAYQIDAVSMRPVGVGELQKAFDLLRTKLAAEGLFDVDRKRALPALPESIGIVTSPTGAVIQDMKNVLRRRFPGVRVVLVPVRVQGVGAAEEIAGAIRDLNRFGNVDVIIVARGGGSLEDLWAFNEEPVARAIAASRIPVVSAVGHESDVTIADFAADMRAPTPSAAAELVVPDRRELLENVANSWYRMRDTVHELLSGHRERVHHLLNSYAFNTPIDLLRRHTQRVDELERTLTTALRHSMALTVARQTSLAQRLRALDPRSALKRGFAIVRKGGHIVSSRSGLGADDRLDIEFQDGTIRSKILRDDT